MRYMFVASFFALSVLGVASVVAKESDILPQEIIERDGALKLQPSTGWNLEFADDRCRLSRQFGEPDAPHLLFIEQIAPGPQFDLTLAGPSVTGFSTQLWLYRGMRSDRNMVSFDMFEGQITGFGGSILMPSVTFAAEEDHEGVSSARIEPGHAELVERIVLRQASRIVSFETGNMKPAIEALNECATDLLPYWEIDPADHSNYRAAEMSGLKTYFSQVRHQFAKQYGAKGHQALLRIRATINKQGAIESCYQELAASTGAPEPDVCTEIKSMQFKPALNRAGEPIQSFIVRSVQLWPYSPFTTGADGARFGD